MLGSIANERAWQARIKELEVKLAQAEAEGAKENIKIVEKVVVQQKIVRERGQNIVQYVDREVVKYDTRCEIPQPFVDAHNRAAEKIQ
jgi:4-hydroxyphenylpyruvate dioxygenase-like putative hemolysin